MRKSRSASTDLLDELLATPNPPTFVDIDRAAELTGFSGRHFRRVLVENGDYEKLTIRMGKNKKDFIRTTALHEWAKENA